MKRAFLIIGLLMNSCVQAHGGFIEADAIVTMSQNHYKRMAAEERMERVIESKEKKND